MAYFGEHKFYRLVVTNSVTPTTLSYIKHWFPVIGEELITNRFHPTWSISDDYVAQYSLVSKFGSDNVIRTTTGSVTDLLNVTWPTASRFDKSLAVYGDGLNHFTLEFPNPVYVPLWLIRSDAYNIITGVQLLYSDDGIVWTLAKELTTELPVIDNYAVLRFGSYYRLKPTVQLNNLASMLLRSRYYEHYSSLKDFILYKAIGDTTSLPGSPESLTHATLGDIQWRLSGGIYNIVPTLSIGGAPSIHKIAGQNAKAIGPIPGISIVTGSSNELGVGTLSILFDDNGKTWLDWTPSGGLVGGAVMVPSSGRYTLIAGRGTEFGYLSVDVDINNIPKEESTYRVQIDAIVGEILPNIDSTESVLGSTEYRCIYLLNSSRVGALRNIKLHLLPGSSIEIGIQPEGVNYEAPSTVDSNTAPSGVVFSTPTYNNPLLLPNILWGNYIAIWIKRTVQAGVYYDNNNELSAILYGVTL